MGLFKEFRDFALKGSVIDLAIGVIIGAAFGALTKSMVDDVLLPPIGQLVGNLDFSNLYISLSDKLDDANVEYAKVKAAERAAAAVTQPTTDSGTIVPAALDPSLRLPLAEARKLGAVIAYGKFITEFINLMIVAFCVFLLVKAVNTARKRMEKEKATAAAPAPPEVVLLGEIRDILKQKQA